MQRTGSPALFYTLIISLGGFIFGFDASVISGAIGFISAEFQLTAWQQGFVVSSPTLGGLIAMLVAGSVADAIGRRQILICIAFLYVVSAAASAFASSFEVLLIARFVGGMAFCSLLIAPVYIAEISSAESRGKMVSVNQLNIVFGFSASYFSNYYLLNAMQSSDFWLNQFGFQDELWRWMLGIELIPATLWFLLLFTVPKSPRWLVLKNRVEEARQVLIRLNGRQQTAQQLAELKNTSQIQQSGLLDSISELFSKKMRVVILIGLILAISQQATGINVIFFYAPTVFEQSGVGTNAAFMQAVLIGVVNVIFTILAMLTIDKYGRRPLLIVGLVGVIASMSLCTYGFSQAKYALPETVIEQIQRTDEKVNYDALLALKDKQFDSDVSFKNALIGAIGNPGFERHQSEILSQSTSINAQLILIGIVMFVASFAMSLGPVMWVVFSEIFPTHLRGLAISLVGVVNGLTSFTVQLIFPWELATIGATLTFLIYGVFALTGLVFVIAYVPETKGKTLEQLEKSLYPLEKAGI